MPRIELANARHLICARHAGSLLEKLSESNQRLTSLNKPWSELLSSAKFLEYVHGEHADRGYFGSFQAHAVARMPLFVLEMSIYTCSGSSYLKSPIFDPHAFFHSVSQSNPWSMN